MVSLRSNFVETGWLEIQRYVPAALLEGIDLEQLEMEEFIQYLAKARYVAELEEITMANAIIKALRPE